MMLATTRSSGRRGRGFALVAALMVMLVVAILVTAVLTMAMSARLLAGSRQEYTQALYLAEAGVNALMADWRSRGPENPPAQPHEGTLTNGTATGAYSVTWTSPNPAGVVTLTSRGTANADLEGTIYNLARTVQVELDTDGDWAWNHVYYSDTDQPGMEEEPYADVKGGSGEVEVGGVVGDPMDFIDHANGPAGGETLPSPIWDLWHEWVRLDLTCDFLTEAQLPRDPDGDGIPDPRWPDQATLPAFFGSTAVNANPSRHTYWYGSSSTTPLDATAHGADAHVVNDENFFMPDWYGEDNPDAYVCNSNNKRFTVTFSDGNYYGNYYVHGDIHVKNKAHIYGTIIATGNITFYGVEDCSITPEIADPSAPCDERVYYPAIIAGGDVVVRDQGVGEDDLRERLRVSGIVWAGNSYVGQASNVEGCIVAPNVRLGGNYLARYSVPNADGCVYEPGATPPPWFREPDRGEMRPVIRTWREVGL